MLVVCPVANRPQTPLSHNQIDAIEFQLEPHDNRRLLSLCGHSDNHLRLIESTLGVEINYRSHYFQVIGAATTASDAAKLIQNLYSETGTGPMLNPARVQLSLKSIHEENENALEAEQCPIKSIDLSRMQIRPRGLAQRRYINQIFKHDISFGIGPAGTGKTYLAVACAASAFERGLIERILLVRPAVEAGESLGFLPGDLTQKVDPYLRPLYDALYDTLGFDLVEKLLEQNVIEVAPLAYMRGRTLNDAFIILDESQNTTVEQMKMFLTRIGFGSKVVITGDVTQVDLPAHKTSGLRHALSVLNGVPKISFSFFQSNDAVRHPLIQSIIDAYDDHDQKHRTTSNVETKSTTCN